MFALKKIAAIIITFALFLLLWELLSLSNFVNPALFPPPEVVASAALEMATTGELSSDTYASVVRLFLGFTLGAAFGIVAGLLTGISALFEDSAGSMMHFFRFIPPLALVPLAIIWLGIGETSKISLILWTVFFPVWLSTFAGVKNIEKKHIWAAKSLGATTAKTLREVILPSAAPFIKSGARIGLGIAFSVLVAAEMTGAFAGLGFRIVAAHMVFRIDKMLVCIILLGLLGLAADRIFVLLSKKLIPWHTEGSG